MERDAHMSKKYSDYEGLTHEKSVALKAIAKKVQHEKKKLSASDYEYFRQKYCKISKIDC